MWRDLKINYLKILSLFFLAVPGVSGAQTLLITTNSGSFAGIFIKFVRWGLIILIILGVLTLPLTGYLWYRKNRENHFWLDYFKTKGFALRALIIVVSLVLICFRLTDKLIVWIWEFLPFI